MKHSCRSTRDNNNKKNEKYDKRVEEQKQQRQERERQKNDDRKNHDRKKDAADQKKRSRSGFCFTLLAGLEAWAWADVEK